MNYFKKISKPKELRRNLLEGAKTSLLMVKNDRELAQLRDKKKLLLLELITDVQKIKELSSDLDEYLVNDELKKKIDDNTDIIKREISTPDEKEEESTIIRRPAREHKSVEKTVSQPQEDTELDRLEYTLSNIEKKLEALK